MRGSGWNAGTAISILISNSPHHGGQPCPARLSSLKPAEYDGYFDEITQAMATPEFRHDPYSLYARMRREDPVYRSSGGSGT